jgi:hypothetical protein
MVLSKVKTFLSSCSGVKDNARLMASASASSGERYLGNKLAADRQAITFVVPDHDSTPIRLEVLNIAT